MNSSSKYSTNQHHPASNVLLPCILGILIASHSYAHEKHLLNDDWKFSLQETASTYDFSMNTASWISVNLPHDWSIQFPTDPKAPSSGGGGFFMTGFGRYRKTIQVPDTWKDKVLELEFEGVMPCADIWINGTHVAKHVYGYTPIWIELGQHLKYGQKNTIDVQVNNTLHPNTRWYSGSGIYRHVWLHIYEPLHVNLRETDIKTLSLSTEQATMSIEVPIQNQSNSEQETNLSVTVLDKKGNTVASGLSSSSIAPNSNKTIRQELTVSSPMPWSPDTPYLYSTKIELVSQQGKTDTVTIPFGIRTIEANSSNGFLLNSKPIEMFGSNVHHDHGPLGAASFDAAEYRKASILKEAGFNAVRTSHNPPSKTFLKACDELGILVILEFFDGWSSKKNPQDYGKYFDETWSKNLSSAVLRDRNHPSVVMWSIGNEVYERGDSKGLKIAKNLSSRIKELDSSRPVTIGLNGLKTKEMWPELDNIFNTVDVAGYNYELNRHEEDHKRVPERIIYSSESYLVDVFDSWKAVEEFPYVIGDFIWSGIDYLGEAGIGRIFGPDEKVLAHWEGSHYPWHGAICGDIDITGWRRPLSHYRNIVWDRGEKLYLAVQIPEPSGREWQLSKWSHSATLPRWDWPDCIGKEMTVEVYSRYPKVRLYLNDNLIGEQSTTIDQQFRADFKIPYSNGTLIAKGVENGQEKEEYRLVTATKPAKIALRPNKKSLNAGAQDLCFVTAEIQDASGNRVWNADSKIEYHVEGPATIAGIGSGNLKSEESYQSNPRTTYQGRTLLVLRSQDKTGTITLRANNPGLEPAEIKIECH